MLPEARIHIDRTEQIGLLSDLVEGDANSSAVVLLQAVELMGKSALLAEISEHMRDRSTVVLTDLQDQPTIDDLFEDLASQLADQGVEVPRYTSRIEELTTGGNIVVRDSTFRRSQLTMVASSRESTEMRQRALLRDLVNDLRMQPGRRLILFDSYEKVGDEFGHWFRGRLVPQLLRVPGLVVVLAGQRMPQLQRPTRPINLELAPFDAEHVVEWLVKLEATYPDDTMRAVAHVLCVTNEGRPGRIDGVIQTLRRRGWGP